MTYWRELTQVFDWARTHVRRSYYICWAAQAALHHFHGVPKHALAEKRFGVFRHRVTDRSAPLLDGFGRYFPVPVSRHSEVRPADLPTHTDLSVLAESDEAGLCLLESERDRAVYMFNHLEYDAETLQGEYQRDLAAGRPVPKPKNYFPDGDPAADPVNYWRSHARLLFRNWLADIDGSIARSKRHALSAPQQPHNAAHDDIRRLSGLSGGSAGIRTRSGSGASGTTLENRSDNAASAQRCSVSAGTVPPCPSGRSRVAQAPDTTVLA